MTLLFLAHLSGLNIFVADSRQRYRSASARDGALSFRKFPRLHLLAPEKSPHRDMLARLHLLKQNA